ncbi:MAG: hypothetical protein OXR64_05990 [Chloroflexota bacterium]|nr:hypothetical protein [Chloroflexota bacterium]MDE2919382.1 hypothetical protein [Chloroflexota bacterium]
MRIGLVTLCSLRGQIDANLQKIEAFTQQAAAKRCDLVLFPEFSVHGPWVTYDADADPADLERQSEPIPGPSTRRLIQIAATHGLAIGAGIAERGLAPKPFNTYVIVDADGVRHVQRKLQPTTSEMDFYRGGGDDMAPFRLGQISIGVTICADNESPAIHDTLVGLGARVILQPHFDCIKDFQNAGQSWDQILDFNRRDTLKRRAENLAERLGVFALYFDAKDPRAAFHERPHWPHRVTGRSAAFAPGGQLLAANAGNEESLVVVNIKPPATNRSW